MLLDDGQKIKTHLYDIQVGEITLCKGHAVPKAGFAVLKSESQDPPKNQWRQNVVFKAFDDVKQIAYGYVLVPDEFDSQDDIVSVEDVEKAAHNFLKALSHGEATGTGAGHEHKVFEDIGYPVESCIDVDGGVAKAYGVPEDQQCPGAWWIGLKMSDDMWEMAKNGEITGFSIGGNGLRRPYVEKKSTFRAVGKKLKDRLLRTIGKQEVVDKATSYNDIVGPRDLRNQLVDKMWALDEALWSIMDDDEVEDKVAKMQESIDQFVADLKKLDVNKTDNHIEGEMDMTEEQFNKLNTSIETLTGAVGQLVTKMSEEPPKAEPANTDANDGGDPPKEPSGEPNVQPIEKKLEDMDAKINGLTELVKKVAKAPTQKKSDDEPGGEPAQPVKKSLSDQAVGTALSFRVPASS